MVVFHINGIVAAHNRFDFLEWVLIGNRRFLFLSIID